MFAKILLASPSFPRLYADVVISSAPNSNEAKILARNYKKIIERTSTHMSTAKSCTHIKVTGVRCGSPALRGEQFCWLAQPFRSTQLQRVPHPCRALCDRVGILTSTAGCGLADLCAPHEPYSPLIPPSRQPKPDPEKERAENRSRKPTNMVRLLRADR